MILTLIVRATLPHYDLEWEGGRAIEITPEMAREIGEALLAASAAGQGVVIVRRGEEAGCPDSTS